MSIAKVEVSRRQTRLRRTAGLAAVCLTAELSGCAVAAFTQTRLVTQESVQAYPTKEVLLERMGGPSEIECKSDGHEVWTYNGERRMSGAFLWLVIVPVPLMAPIARDTKTFDLDGERVTSFRQDLTQQCETGVVAAPSNPLGRSGASADCGYKEFTQDPDRIEPARARTFCQAHAR